jgi:signal transduction histidine kinase
LALRTRAMVAFGMAVLVLSGAVALTCYLVTRSALVSQRETAAERQTYLNARAVRSSFDGGSGDIAAALTTVQTSSGGSALLRVGGDWFSTSVGVGRDDVPSPLREVLRQGDAGRQRIELGDVPLVVVGVPLGDTDVHYVEFVPLDEVAATLDSVRAGLVVSAVVMTAFGLIAGRVASGRILRPVGQMAEAATGIGEGALDRRLDSDGDRDLEPLVEAFNKMVDGLQARIERETRFASDVSHELRSPLATMDAALSVARRRTDQPTAQDALDVLEGEVGRFSDLVDDLLEISRAEAGIAQLNLEEVDAVGLVRAVLAGTDRDSVAVVDAAEGAAVAVDKRRFGQVLVNLLDNADNYAGGATAVRVSATDDRVRYEVDDDGPGIADHERAHVFDRFARGTTSELPGAGAGTGLGLALVHEHVRLHAGTVTVGVSDGGGARFTIELPRVGAS